MNKNQEKRITIISITTYYARQIFDKTKPYEFRKSPLKKELLDKKIYVYSAKKDKAIIGYFKVSDILNGSTDEILKATGYDVRSDDHEIIEYFGKNNPNCFALRLYDVTEFTEYLSLKDMKNISKNAYMPQYIKYIYEDNPLYDLIRGWDDAFSLGNVCNNPNKIKQEILEKSRMKGRK